jgi:hypothetical protein
VNLNATVDIDVVVRPFSDRSDRTRSDRSSIAAPTTNVPSTPRVKVNDHGGVQVQLQVNVDV